MRAVSTAIDSLVPFSTPKIEGALDPKAESLAVNALFGLWAWHSSDTLWMLGLSLLLLYLLFRELPQAWLALAKQIRFAHQGGDARRWRTLCCAGLMRGRFHHVLDFAFGLAA